MTATKSKSPADPTERARRKHLTDREIKDLELAGGAEGGMQAGTAGGPGQKDAEARENRKPASR